MRVKYFPDTDTALMEFTDNEVAETREISENIYADLDRHGNLVSMTIEHARPTLACRSSRIRKWWGERRRKAEPGDGADAEGTARLIERRSALR